MSNREAEGIHAAEIFWDLHAPNLFDAESESNQLDHATQIGGIFAVDYSLREGNLRGLATAPPESVRNLTWSIHRED